MKNMQKDYENQSWHHEGQLFSLKKALFNLHVK